jgi:hypothetical protein
VTEGLISNGIREGEKVHVDTTISAQKSSISVDEKVVVPVLEGEGVHAVEETLTVTETPSVYYIPATEVPSAGRELPKTDGTKGTPAVEKAPVIEGFIATEHSNIPGMEGTPEVEIREEMNPDVRVEVSEELRAEDALVVKETTTPISALPLATKPKTVEYVNEKSVAILDSPPHLRAFGELFSVVMVAFSGFYMAARPATVMEFNSVLNRFFQQLERAASKGGKKKSQKAIADFLNCSRNAVGPS